VVQQGANKIQNRKKSGERRGKRSFLAPGKKLEGQVELRWKTRRTSLKVGERKKEGDGARGGKQGPGAAKKRVNSLLLGPRGDDWQTPKERRRKVITETDMCRFTVRGKGGKKENTKMYDTLPETPAGGGRGGKVDSGNGGGPRGERS